MLAAPKRCRRLCAAYGRPCACPSFSVQTKQAVRVATQHASAPCKLTISSHLFARWHLFRPVDYLRHQQQVDLWLLTLKVVSESRVTWATSVLVYFSFPRSLCSRVRPDVRDRQTDVRQKHHLMPPPYGAEA